MIVGILLNPGKPGALPTLEAFCEALGRVGLEWRMDEEAAALAGRGGGMSASLMGEVADVVAVLGGDGTMLHAVSKLGQFEKPVAGIHIGTLGFLTSCTDGELDELAGALAAGRYSTSRRTLLEVEVRRSGEPVESFVALNEVSLARGATGRLVSLRVLVDGHLLNDYRADGLLVATPTGSTAYSLAAGGPLISPSAGVFVITPVCPHSLSQRCLVLADDSVIELSPLDGEPVPMLFTVDGRDTMPILPDDRIVIRKAARSFHLLRLEGRCFYQALRQKLRWQGI